MLFIYFNEQMKVQGYDYVCQTGYERLLGPEGRQDAVALAIKLNKITQTRLNGIHYHSALFALCKKMNTSEKTVSVLILKAQ